MQIVTFTLGPIHMHDTIFADDCYSDVYDCLYMAQFLYFCLMLKKRLLSFLWIAYYSRKGKL